MQNKRNRRQEKRKSKRLEAKSTASVQQIYIIGIPETEDKANEAETIGTN